MGNGSNSLNTNANSNNNKFNGNNAGSLDAAQLQQVCINPHKSPSGPSSHPPSLCLHMHSKSFCRSNYWQLSSNNKGCVVAHPSQHFCHHTVVPHPLALFNTPLYPRKIVTVGRNAKETTVATAATTDAIATGGDSFSLSTQPLNIPSATNLLRCIRPLYTSSRNTHTLTSSNN